MAATFTFNERRIPAGDDGKREIEVSRNGRPYGLLWTWEGIPDEWHPWHAKPLHGDHHTYMTLAAAKAAIQLN